VPSFAIYRLKAGGKMDKLVILWTTDNKETALDMVLMYALKSNINKWWKSCELITWGPSNKLVCCDEEVREQLRLIQEAGVKVTACKRCAERYGLVEKLEDLGIEVKFMGEPLTEYLKDEN
jgi:hypothetical protein